VATATTTNEEESIYTNSRYCKLPIKWMAPESVHHRQFTSRSDAWMFAVCMWEIVSYGARPHAGVKNADVARLIEQGGAVLEQPARCPGDLYAIMLKCWQREPGQRPTFAQLNASIHSLLHNGKAVAIGDQAAVGKSASSSNSSSCCRSNSSIASNLSKEQTQQQQNQPMPHIVLGDETGSARSMLTANESKKPSFSPSVKSPKKPFKSGDSSPIKTTGALHAFKSKTTIETTTMSKKNNDGEFISERFRTLELNHSIQVSMNTTTAINMDLVLRDHTLKLIQTISTFIRRLNDSEAEKIKLLDVELKEIVATLKELIALIEQIELDGSGGGGSARIARLISELESSLSCMVDEFRAGQVERVVGAALELARTANDLFLTITTTAVTSS
jgi:hypothetical protein